MMHGLSQEHRLVSASGGQVLYVTPDGELLAAVAVPAGIQPAGPYLELCPEGATIELVDLAPLKPRERVSIQGYGEAAFASSANPDYQPTSATRNELEMRMMLNKMKAATKRIEARANAVALIETIPFNPPKEDVPISGEETPDLPAPGQNGSPENPDLAG